jgi:hypothetical protein
MYSPSGGGCGRYVHGVVLFRVGIDKLDSSINQGLVFLDILDLFVARAISVPIRRGRG